MPPFCERWYFTEFNRPFDVKIQGLRENWETIDKEISAEIRRRLEKEGLLEISRGVESYCRNKGVELTDEIYAKSERAISMRKKIMRSKKILRKEEEQDKIEKEISEINRERYDFSTVPAELRSNLVVGKQGTLIYRKEETTPRLAGFVDDLSSFRDMGDLPEKLKKTKQVGYIAYVEVPFASRGKGFAQTLIEIALWDLHNRMRNRFCYALITGENIKGRSMAKALTKGGFVNLGVVPVGMGASYAVWLHEFKG